MYASFLCRYHALTLMYAPYSILSNCKYLDTCICETLKIERVLSAYCKGKACHPNGIKIEIVEAAARTHAVCFI